MPDFADIDDIAKILNHAYEICSPIQVAFFVSLFSNHSCTAHELLWLVFLLL